MLGRRHTAHALAAVLALVVCTYAAAGSTQSSALPTVVDARTIVNTLWSQREDAFAMRDKTRIDAIESTSARQQDENYIRSLLCNCERPKDPQVASGVIPQIPRSSVQPVFFAQVQATSEVTHKSVWYVVAVERDASGSWKLAFVNVGRSVAGPPLHALTGSAGYTAPVTAQSQTRMLSLAQASVRYASARTESVSSTSWGATIHNRITLDPARDGVYGLALPSGQVLSCFTLHSINTYTVASGVLQQRPTQTQWGHLLAPGSYSSITSDTGVPICVSGRGTGAVGRLRFDYEQRVVGTTGIPA